MLAKFSGVESERTVFNISLEKETENFCVGMCLPTPYGKRMKLGSFVSESCNDGYEMYKKA